MSTTRRRSGSASFAVITNDGVKDLVPIAQCLAEAEEARGREQPEFSDTELASFTVYCEAGLALRKLREEIRVRVKDQRRLSKVKSKEIEEQVRSLAPIESEMVYRVAPADAEKGVPQFVRVSRRPTSSRAITPKVVGDSIRGVSREQVLALLEKWSTMRDKKHMTPVDAFVHAVTANIGETRTTYKEVMQLTTAVPRGVEALKIQVAPSDLIEKCYAVYRAKSEIRTVTTEFKAAIKEVSERSKAAKPYVEQCLIRNGIDSQKVTTKTQGVVFVRRKIRRQKPPIKVKDLTEAIKGKLSLASSLDMVFEHLGDLATAVQTELEQQPYVVFEDVAMDMAPRNKRARSEDDEMSGSDSDSDSDIET
jgi:hypothetical protein